MTKSEALGICERVHAYLMSNRQFWYDKALREADKLFCVAASDLRLKMRGSRDAGR